MTDSATESKPTDNIWDGDLLGRKEEAVYLQRYIENLYRLDKKDQTSFVLNINSEWGHGKTWFLVRLKQELAKNHPVVYFDAWKNDFSKDALLSFVSIVCEGLSGQFTGQPEINSKVKAIKDTFSKWAKKAVPIVAAATVKQLTGVALDTFEDRSCVDFSNSDISKIAEELTKVASSCAIEEFTRKKSAIDLFDQSIKALVEAIESSSNLHLPICIFIDELDRCRPTYAIELLEAVKHLFAIKGIFFVLATDTRQLSHSIKAVYGQDFNAIAYLKRFFYSEYSLENPNYLEVANYFLSLSNIQEKLYLPESLKRDLGFNQIFAKTAELFQLHMRQQEQIFNNLESIVVCSEKKQFHVILLLLILCMKNKYPIDYRRLASTPNGSKFGEFIKQKYNDVEIRQIKLTGQYETQNSIETKEFSLKSVFEFYFSILDGDLNNGYLNLSGGFLWQTEIAKNLIGENKRHYPGGKYSGSHDLGEYFNVVDQAGKIVSS